MKTFKYLLYFPLMMGNIVFAQDNTFSSHVKSQLVNEQGVVQFVTFDESTPLKVENRSDFLKEFLKTSEKTSFVKISSQKDELKIVHETYQQYFNTLPVEFGIYKTHLKNGVLQAINGDYFLMNEMETIPTISKENAISIAKRHVNAENYYDSSVKAIGYEGPNPTLVVFPKLENINTRDRLAYRLEIYAEKPLYRADVYIDAHTGEVIFEKNKIHQSNIGAIGTTLYNGVKNFRAEQFSGGYRLRQTVSGNGIQTLNATNGSLQNATDYISSTNNFNLNPEAVQVHWGAERTHQYFLQKHNRNSFDGNGALIKSYITPPSANANAIWTGSAMLFSLGNGTNMGPVTSLDVVGHEFTHAVIDYTADLIYSNQSGAINESFADIFGEMVENFGQGTNDWLCGAAFTPNGIRSLSNPKSNGDPDTYLGQYWQTTPDDNYGVHTNSGVHNKWFYLLAVGGSGTNDNGYSYNFSGIGIEKAAAIAYRNLKVYLVPTANYHYTCESSLYAAKVLFGTNSPEHIATAQAWRAVGLLTPQTDYIPPTTPLNLVATNTTSNNIISATLSWDASTDNVGVLGYTIYRNSSLIGVSSTTSYNVPQDMVSDVIYDFRVQAFDAAGNVSGLSNIDSIWVDTTAPTAPINLVSSDTTSYSTVLTWDASTDAIGVIGYKIYDGLSPFQTVTNITSTTLNNLIPNNNYNFRVTAIDAAGHESNSSNTVSVITPMLCTGGNGNLMLTINFGDFPPGVNWNIKDATNNIVASGGNYSFSLAGGTLVEQITLSPGFYSFDIFDEWSSTPGGFILESNQVIASNTNIWSYLPTTFCVNTSVNREVSSNVKLTNSGSGFIYPNPASDKLYINSVEKDSHPFLIVDITGKVIMEGALDADNSIDVSQLQSGLYMLGIMNEDKTENYKFIKK
ncbi:M4 family metallopeptidase [Flavobacterium sp.]|uniref:M4 family metallopeptidase n=1 Tax=Flavobacterium sp. TaxID=239 RepID=UPI00352998A9